MYNIFGNFSYDLLSVSQLNEWKSRKKEGYCLNPNNKEHFQHPALDKHN